MTDFMSYKLLFLTKFEYQLVFNRHNISFHKPWCLCLVNLISSTDNSRYLFIYLFFLQAKRDPYRFRFPIELRFVDPNIDHLMYVFVMINFV